MSKICVSIVAVSGFFSGLLAPLVTATPCWEKITYRGWSDCYRIRSGDISLVVAGDIGGRVMEYSARGENVLWQDPACFGLTIRDKTWLHPGGSQFDLLKEDGNELSAVDPELWFGKYVMEIVSPGHLRATSPVGAKSGIQLIRDVKMDAATNKVSVAQTVVNHSGKEVTLSIWDRTWTLAPRFLLLPVLSDPSLPDGWAYLSMNNKQWAGLPKESDPATSAQFVRTGDLLVISPQGLTCQIVINSRAGWFAYVKDKLLYVKKSRLLPGRPPWLGYPVSVWLSEKNWKKVGIMGEMEILGPLTKLGTEESFCFEQEWYLLKMTNPVDQTAHIPAARKLVEDIIRR